MDLRTLSIIVILLATISINIVMAVIVLVRRLTNKKVKYLFAVLTSSVSLWAYFNAHFQITTDNHTAYNLAIGSYVVGLIIVTVLWLMSIYLFEEAKKLTIIQYGVLGLSGISAIAITVFPHHILTNVSIDQIPRQLLPTELIVLYGSYVIGLFLLSIIELLKRLQSSTGLKKLQYGVVCAGLFLSGILGLICNLILPLFGNYSYVWLGPNFSLIFVMAVGYSIAKYRLFDITVKTQSFINIGLPMVIATTCSIVIGLFVESTRSSARLTIGEIAVLIGGALILARLLEWGIQNTRLRYALSSTVHNYQTTLKQLAEQASSIVDLEELIDRAIEVLTESMRLRHAAIIVKQFEPSLKLNFIRARGWQVTELEHWTKPSDILANAFKQRTVYVTDEIQYELNNKPSPQQADRLCTIQQLLRGSNAAVVLGLSVQQNLIGFVLLGPKPSGAYTSEDISLLEHVAHKLAIAMMHSTMHEAKTTVTRALRQEVQEATDALRCQLQYNEELSQMKSRFIEVASHQLRTPISVIRNSLELIINDYITREEEKSHGPTQTLTALKPLINNAFLASQNLNSTLNNILAAEEFIGGKPSAWVQQMDLKLFLQQRKARALQLAQAKPDHAVLIETQFDDQLPETITIDVKKLATIIDQLLMNAILYTPQGTVNFQAWSGADTVILSITDTGIGIDSKDHAMVFEQFSRLPAAVRIVPDGTGLGLYLVMRYVELLRGRLLMCSSPQEGTTIRIIVPLHYQYIQT